MVRATVQAERANNAVMYGGGRHNGRGPAWSYTLLDTIV